MADSIIARDLEFYESCLESNQTSLRRCAPASEPYWREQIRLTGDVVAALRALQAHTRPVSLPNEERPEDEDMNGEG